MLRRAAAYLSQANLSWVARKMMYPLVSELAADGIPVTVACGVLKLARQPYYRWREDPVTEPSGPERIGSTRCATLISTIRPSATGSWPMRPRERLEDEPAHRVVAVLELGIVSSATPTRGKGKKAGPPVFDDHVQRMFTADAPNRVWLTDITEHPTSRASSTAARSRTCAATGSWATPSATG